MWRVYYADGSTFSYLDGPPENAPGLGVICIVQVTSDKVREILHGNGPRVIDYFWWEAEHWLCGDLAGLLQYLADPGWRKVLIGRNLPNPKFHEVMGRAIADDLA